MTQELHTLISLLEDTDREVFQAVTDELLKQGLSVIPQLEKAWESTPSERVQEKLEAVIHTIQFSNTQSKIRGWIDSGSKNILEGASFIAQLQYPNADFAILNKEIEKIASDVYLSSGNHLTAIEKVKLLNYVIYELNHFNRNTANFYSPQNSFINQVFETRKGNPISLGIVYLAVAQKVGLPIYGVNLPKSFVLAYVNEYRHIEATDKSSDILFYINPYNKGSILYRADIDNFLKQQKLEMNKEYYVPCDNKNIISRLIANLIIAYKKLDFEEKTKILEQLLVEFNVKPDRHFL